MKNETLEILKEKFNILSVFDESTQSPMVIEVDGIELAEIVGSLKNMPEFDYDMLYAISGSDFGEYLQLDYLLCSSKQSGRLIVRVKTGKNIAQVPSVAQVFASADWDEREIFDLLGINFSGRKSLERLFMPKGWAGHPLRKDYVQDDKRLAWNG